MPQHRRCRAHRALVAAALALAAAPAAALAQAPGAPQREVARPSGSEMENRGRQQDASVTADQLRTVEQSLRQVAEQVGTPETGVDRARTAVVSGQSVLARIPQERRTTQEFAQAQERLAMARRELEAPRADTAEASVRLAAAAEAVAALSRSLGGPTEATRAVGTPPSQQGLASPPR